MTTTLVIEGMRCPKCPGKAQTALEAVRSVRSARVSLETKSAVVDHDESVPVEALTGAVASAGFTGKVESRKRKMEGAMWKLLFLRFTDKREKISGAYGSPVSLVISGVAGNDMRNAVLPRRRVLDGILKVLPSEREGGLDGRAAHGMTVNMRVKVSTTRYTKPVFLSSLSAR
ncbi:MAG: copper-transporting ATPase 1 [Treponematales bacterium]